MLIFNKIVLSQEFKRLLKIHFNSKYEVGGIIYAKRKGFQVVLNTLSFKKGVALSLSFYDDDKFLFLKPKRHFILGTWHTHPFQKEINPSSIDLSQWKKWNRRFLHLIYNGTQIKIYNSGGNLIYVDKTK